MTMMRAAGAWHKELQRRSNASGDEAERLMEEVGELTVQIEEANALCAEVHEAMPGALIFTIFTFFTFFPKSISAVNPSGMRDMEISSRQSKSQRNSAYILVLEHRK